MRDELREARYGLKELAEDSGVDHGYIKQLSAGNQGAGEPTLRALALGLVKHARRLLDLAARFLSQAGSPRDAEAARSQAEAIKKAFPP